MQNQIMGYDRTSAIFSPDGHLLQVEYAEKTVRLGSASIGMVTSEGVVIVADRRVKDKLMVTESMAKIYEIDSHIGATAAGILSDARVLVQKAQLGAQQHRVMYDSPIEVDTIVKDIADTKQTFTQYGGARPFGIAMLIAGVDQNDKRSVFTTDVTGNYFGFRATAIGENDEKIKEMLRKEYRESLSTEGGIRLAVSIFKRILGKNFDADRLEAAFVSTKDKKFTKFAGEELAKYLK